MGCVKKIDNQLISEPQGGPAGEKTRSKETGGGAGRANSAPSAAMTTLMSVSSDDAARSFNDAPHQSENMAQLTNPAAGLSGR